MSGHAVIAEVGTFLVGLLKRGTDGVPANDSGPVLLANPKKAREQNAKLSLWLYSIVPNEHLRNAANMRIRRDDDEKIQFPPLALNLHYLLTPMLKDDRECQQLLGRAMQILNDSAVVLFTGTEADPEELHISLEQHSIQELSEVWEALQEPYQLSVCYGVRVVRIPSGRELDAGRVHERSTEFKRVEATS